VEIQSELNLMKRIETAHATPGLWQKEIKGRLSLGRSLGLGDCGGKFPGGNPEDL